MRSNLSDISERRITPSENPPFGGDRAARRSPPAGLTSSRRSTAWAAKQEPPVTRPEAIRGMIDAILLILAKDPGEKPAKKASIR
jgi:hypothetical protein